MAHIWIIAIALTASTVHASTTRRRCTIPVVDVGKAGDLTLRQLLDNIVGPCERSRCPRSTGGCVRGAIAG